MVFIRYTDRWQAEVISKTNDIICYVRSGDIVAILHAEEGELERRWSCYWKVLTSTGVVGEMYVRTGRYVKL